jgi:WhiB family transcriptional regulator, redox-sensing transcriptional regulator
VNVITDTLMPAGTTGGDLSSQAEGPEDPLGSEEQDWQERALCAQTDPEAFFPEKGGSTREAKRICSGCDVRAECLEYALAHDERFGIWGGLSERERRRLRRAVG